MKYLYGLYLGGALAAFADITFLQWQFYAVLVPTIILVEYFNNK